MARLCWTLCLLFSSSLPFFFDGWRDQIEKSFSHRNLVISRAICSLGNCKTMPLRVNFGFKRALLVEHLRAAGCGYIFFAAINYIIWSPYIYIYYIILQYMCTLLVAMFFPPICSP